LAEKAATTLQVNKALYLSLDDDKQYCILSSMVPILI